MTEIAVQHDPTEPTMPEPVEPDADDPLTFEDLPEIKGMALENLSKEAVRTYYVDGLKVHEITDPIGLYVGPDTHLVEDSAGLQHFVPFPNGGRTSITISNQDRRMEKL